MFERLEWVPEMTIVRSGCHFHDLMDTPKEAEDLKIRSRLMIKIADLIEAQGWSQKVAAKECGVTVPRMNALIKGHINKFSIDALVSIAARLGQTVSVDMTETASERGYL